MKTSSLPVPSSIRSIGHLVAMAGFASSPMADAADWPTWRGADGTGRSREAGLHMDWTGGAPPLVWQSEGCGKGYASVAVADGRVFTIGRRDDGECLTAFSEKDGALLWSTVFGAADHSNGAPTVDGEFVYAIGLDGDLVCCRAASGEIVWRKRFKEDFDGRMMSGWGFSESPLIDGDRLVCTPGAADAMLVALDKRTGEEIWRCGVPEDLGNKGRDGAGYSSIAVSEGAGVRQYVQMTGRGLVGVRASDGKFLWSYNRVANETANIPTPLVDGDLVFGSTGYGTGAALLRLARDGDGVRADEVYFLESKVLQNHHGGMILVDGHVYCGHRHNEGFPICVDLESGEVAWGGDERGPGSGSAAITFADGHLIFRYQNGTVALIEATPEAMRLKGTFTPAHQEGNSWAHPVVANGRLYLREQDQLMAYDLRAR